jgi:putative NADPH-quinone reductase
MKNLLIINGHPDASPGRLSSALAAAYQEGAEAAGHTVRRINIGAIEFPVLRDPSKFTSKPSEVAILDAQNEFLKADHLVFIFPLWLGGPPALLKAFLEQIACGQFLLRERKHGFPTGGLKGRSASVIVTMGMPPLLYRVIFGARGIKSFNQGILRLSGLSPIRAYYFGGAAITPPGCTRLIQKLREMGRKAA